MAKPRRQGSSVIRSVDRVNLRLLITIVGGLMAALLMSIFLLPAMYVWIAGDSDILPAPEGEFE